MNVADLLPSAAPEGKYGKPPFGSCCAMMFAGGGSRTRRRYVRGTRLFIYPVTHFYSIYKQICEPFIHHASQNYFYTRARNH